MSQQFILLQGKYKLNKRLENEGYHCQGVYGKIIEKELEPFVRNKGISGIRFESSLGLHTLRLGLENDDRYIVVHMAKEALKAFELTPFKEKGLEAKPGILMRFRPNVSAEYGYPSDKEKYDEHHVDLGQLERGISEQTKPLCQFTNRTIKAVFPSWYYEDWVQVQSYGRSILIRMDCHGLYGLGIGKTENSTLYPGMKEDTIFYWKEGMDRNMARYYDKFEFGGGSSGGPYMGKFAKEIAEK